MNKMKKLASLLLALVMVFAMAVPAMAAMEGPLTGGSITIKDAVLGQTYSAYQILYLESYNPAEGKEAYAYKANSAWAEWLKDQTGFVTIDGQGYVTWVDGADVDEFAKLAQEQLTGKTADKTAEVNADGAVVLSDLNLGYYLVDTTLGTLCSLDTTNPNVEMKEKNEAPTVTKEVQEDSDGKWGETNDADINQVVNYKATVTVQAGAENYVLHDTMSAGLTFNPSSVKVSVDGDEVPATVTEGETTTTNYTLVTSNLDDGCTFEVVFDNDYIATLKADTEIVVEYSATLNENAVVGLDGNTNEVVLEYGDANDTTNTPKETTTTYTWDMNVVKYTKVGNDKVNLAGATFKLSTDAAGGSVLKFHDLDDNKYEVCANVKCAEEHKTEITTDDTGTFNIKGIDAGTYYLTETKAPDGYNKLAGPVEVVITGATTNAENNKLEYTTVTQEVENKTGTELPSTGGMGTTMLYVVGGLLVAGAVVVMISKKKAEEK